MSPARFLLPTADGAYGGGTYDLVGPVGAFAFQTQPVNSGGTLILYGVGFGPTIPQVKAGQAFSGVASTASAVSISIGGVAATVAFSGITEAGLYQFNVIVPANAGSGDQPITAVVNGVATPTGAVLRSGSLGINAAGPVQDSYGSNRTRVILTLRSKRVEQPSSRGPDQIGPTQMAEGASFRTAATDYSS